MLSMQARKLFFSELFVIVLMLHSYNYTADSYSIEIQPKDLMIDSGASATLQCKFDVSATSCLWRYDNVLINAESFLPDYQTQKNKNGICNLHIRSVSVDRDDGNWTCLLPRSQDGEGLLSRTARLTVMVLPTPPLVHNAGENQVFIARDGTEVKLQCKTKHGYPATNFSWLMEDGWLQDTKTSTEEEINHSKLLTSSTKITLNIKKTDHGKNIYCVARHGNRRLNTCLTLNVQYNTSHISITPQSMLRVPPGEKVALRCKADGNPLPKYLWKAKLSSSTSWRTISTKANHDLTVTEHSEGKYICEAGNEHFLHSEELTITVLEGSNAQTTLIILAVFCGSIVLLPICMVFLLRRHLQRRSKLSTM